MYDFNRIILHLQIEVCKEKIPEPVFKFLRHFFFIFFTHFPGRRCYNAKDAFRVRTKRFFRYPAICFLKANASIIAVNPVGAAIIRALEIVFMKLFADETDGLEEAIKKMTRCSPNGFEK